eukprot:TRINITY_DN10701_c0_g1_i1.p1 TRINITY_DN10701_c0_g1~~TRINITY_DN10701_c0_g1_i1.p1  ORF type:complete len:1450 (-),score=304.68 TRINITY_DN10701_c0_g1_i1:114-4463(-)
MNGAAPPPPSTGEVVQVQERVKLASVIKLLIQYSYNRLVILARGLPSKDSNTRKVRLLRFLKRSRSLFIRLLVLVKWSKLPPTDQCWALVEQLNKESEHFREAADTLAFAHGRLNGARAPPYDLNTAIDVLSSGSYLRLPQCIKRQLTDLPVSTVIETAGASETETSGQSVLSRLNHEIEHRLLQCSIPPEISSFEVSKGCAFVEVDGEFRVVMTVSGDSSDLNFSILDVEMLISSYRPDSNVLAPCRLSQNQKAWLREISQRQMRASPGASLSALYAVMHSFCVNLQMELLHAQAWSLMHGSLRGLVAVKYTEGDSCSPVLEVAYWREEEEEEPVEVATSTGATSASSASATPSLSAPLPRNGSDAQESTCAELLEAGSIRIEVVECYSDLLYRPDDDVGAEASSAAPSTASTPQSNNNNTGDATDGASSMDDTADPASTETSPPCTTVSASRRKCFRFANLRVTHQPPLIDPRTGETAVFTVDATRVSMEAVYNEALRLHSLARLQKLLLVTQEIGLSDNTVSDHSREWLDDEGTREMVSLLYNPDNLSDARLRIVLFHDRLLLVGVDPCHGRLSLSVSPHVSGHSTTTLVELSAQVNDEPRHIYDIVLKLRLEAITDFYSDIAVRRALEPFRHVPVIINAREKLHNKPVLYLRFAEANSFFLVLRLDPVTFTPSFQVLRTVFVRQGRLQLNLSHLDATYEVILDAPASRIVALAEGAGMPPPPPSPSTDASSTPSPAPRRTEPSQAVPGDASGQSHLSAAYHSWMLSAAAEICRRCRMNNLTLIERFREKNLLALGQDPESQLLAGRAAVRLVMPRAFTPLECETYFFLFLKHDLTCCIRALVPKFKLYRVLFDSAFSEDTIQFRSLPSSDDGNSKTTPVEWLFEYSQVETETITYFARDLRVVCYVSEIAHQWQEMLEEGYDLCKRYKLVSLQARSLVFLFDGDQHLHMKWRTERGFVCTFSPRFHPLKRFMEEALGTVVDLKKLLWQVLCNTRPLIHVRNFLVPIVGFLAGDFTHIPRSSTSSRLVFRSSYALDLRFFHPDRAVVSDAHNLIFPHSKSARDAVPSNYSSCYSKLRNFRGFLETHVLSINEADCSNTDMNTSSVSGDTSTATASATSSPSLSSATNLTGDPNDIYFVATTTFPRFLPLFHSYVGTLYLYRMSVQLLERLFPASQVNVSDESVSFQVPDYPVSFVLTISSYTTLVIAVKDHDSSASGEPNAQTAQAAPTTFFTQEENELLVKMFAVHVACPPYQHQTFSAFVQLLTLPSSLFKQFLHLLKLSTGDARPSTAHTLDLCFVLPRGFKSNGAVTHDRSASTVSFVVRITENRGHNFVEIPLALAYTVIASPVAVPTNNSDGSTAEAPSALTIDLSLHDRSEVMQKEFQALLRLSQTNATPPRSDLLGILDSLCRVSFSILSDVFKGRSKLSKSVDTFQPTGSLTPMAIG